jgi:hypothetical protein
MMPLPILFLETTHMLILTRIRVGINIEVSGYFSTIFQNEFFLTILPSLNSR